MTIPEVVVGVDGSAGSDQAVRWTLGLATRRRLPARRRRWFRGMLLGSTTSQALVQHAQCPVLVVRHRPDE